jgi:hypothetical protein
MVEPIDTALLRLSWAADQINRSKLLIKKFFDEECGIRTEKESDGVYSVRALLRSDRLPTEVRFVIGDCVNNIRSTLDNVIWELGQLYGEPRRNRLSFPICHSDAEFFSIYPNLMRLPEPIRDVVELVQPYHREDPSGHPLARLNRLWNDYKHRVPPLAVTHTARVAANAVLDPPRVDGVGVVGLEVFDHFPAWERLYNGAVLGRVRVPAGLEKNLDVYGLFGVTFEDSRVRREVSPHVVRVLEIAHRCARDSVVNEIARVFVGSEKDQAF